MVAQPTEVSGTIAARFGQCRNNHEECVVQPTAGTLGNRGLRSHTELDGHGAYIPVAQPVPYDLFQITAPVNRQNRKPGDPCHTLARDNAAHAAVAFTVDMQACKGNANVGDGSVSPTLCKPSGNDVHAVAFPINTMTLGGRPDPRNDARMTMGVGDNDDAQFTLSKAHSHAVAHAFYSTGGTHGVNQHAEVSPAVKVGSGLGIPSPPAVAHSLRADGFDASEDGTGRGTPLVPQAMTVRRLLPEECESLQGFSRGWTRIPWRGKPAEQCPDGPRYKALGNSMACNCMAWIGERIAAHEQRGRVDPTPAAVSRLTGGGGDSNEGGCHA